ncbi:hypothetical protein ACJDT4_18990 [Clostridium neuense]|uniref:Uncharacterized protein n=1 Tax=Clostridium neuense TaxID=1728934 RepID=A0ABW8TKZ2_9CLOT
MNKEFVKKMLKAEMLRYSAIKEIMPEAIKDRIDKFEKEASGVLKEVAFEAFEEKSEDNPKECKKVNIN